MTSVLLDSWEAEAAPVTLEAAELLADVYLIPFVAWFQNDLPMLPVLDFRRGDPNSNVLSYEAHRRLATFERLYDTVTRLLVALGDIESAATPSLPALDRDDGVDAEAVGERVRRSLGIDDDTQLSWRSQDEAFTSIRGRVEANRVFVFEGQAPLDSLRAAARWDDRGPAAIFLNSGDSTTAKTFSLLHEYVHLARRAGDSATVLCDPSDAQAATDSGLVEERIANRAAAAALVPASLLDLVLPSILPDGPFPEWPPALRLRVQRTFHVSSIVIGIRLHHLRGSGAPRWRSIWRAPNPENRGRRVPNAVRLRRLLGNRGTDLVRRAMDQQVASAAEVARSLGDKVADVALVVGESVA